MIVSEYVIEAGIMPNTGNLIFLDVGGHRGQTLEEVLKPEYGFDRVHCFEPFPAFSQLIREKFAEDVAGGKLFVHSFGLSDQKSSVTLYGDNTGGGATVFESKCDHENKSVQTVIELESASEFCRTHLSPEDRVLMKLNCEGAECAILRDLVASGEIFKFTGIMIDFDMFKVRGKRHEPYQVIKLLKETGFDRFRLASDVMVGKSHQLRIRNWLTGVHRTTRLTSSETFLNAPQRRPKFLKQFLRSVRFRVLAVLGL